MPAVAVIGMQWGDEGKGKVVDLLSERAVHIARAQGGNNAGHTIVIANQEYRFHLIPSGILYPHTTCYIGGGTVLDPPSFLAELEELERHRLPFKGRLWISPYTHIVFPYHHLLDALAEAGKGKSGIGTTKRGIGPCYADKVNRLGIRMGDLISKKTFRHKLTETLQWKNFELERLYGEKPLDAEEMARTYEAYGEKLAPYVAPVEEMLFQAAQRKENILFEGAQGALLDVTFGTYPFVTSSCTLAGGVPSGLGLGPTSVDRVVGVAKAYTTRVGHGPFPTECSEEEMRLFPDHTESREIGVTTGRKRRIGWLDLPLLTHSIRLNGADSLAMMKLDILDGLKSVQICIGYRIGRDRLRTFPATIEELAQVEPIYETLPGWRCSTRAARSFEELPQEAQNYLRRIEELCHLPIGLFSVGPARDQTCWLDRFFEGRSS